MQTSIFDIECHTSYKIKKPIRLIELFAGIGSQAKAFSNLKISFEHYRICEFDKYAVQSYNAIHGTNFKTSDITKIHAADLGITDTDKFCYIMTYSFPCQDLSVAGQQNGMTKGSGTRSGLLWEVERLLDECEELPQVLLMENVPQVLCDDFGKWLEFLEKLGYKNYYKVLNAKNYGIPQNRDRCFMVSVLGDYYYEFPKAIPLELRLKDMLEKTVDEKYYLSEKMINFFKQNEQKQKENGNGFRFGVTDGNCIAKAVTTRAGGRMDDNFIEEKCQVVGNLNIPGRMESACRVHGINGIAPACNTCGGGGLETKIAEPVLIGGIGEINFGTQFRQGNRIYDSKEIACALTANTVGNAGGESYLYKVDMNYTTPNIIFHNKHYQPVLMLKTKESEIYYITVNGKNIGIIKQGDNWFAIRKLTPKECWRLMGFTDSDFDKAKASGVSNSQLYKQAGNSIVVPVLQAIFRQLI